MNSWSSIRGYDRPTTIDEALQQLSAPGAALIGGGHRLAAGRPAGIEILVDLQDLGLARLTKLPDGRVSFGATTTLEHVADTSYLPSTITDAARRELPSSLRTRATIGGLVATAEWDSELLTALLAYDASVKLRDRDGEWSLPLAEVLADTQVLTGRIITAVVVDPSGRSAAFRTARTRADRPIVAAVARRTPTGETRLALCGVSKSPVLAAQLESLQPPGDFRGSSFYRRQLASVLASRAIGAVTK